MANDFDVKTWLGSLKTQFPDLQIPKEAEDGWLRQSDYDRNMNRLKDEHTERMKKEDDFHAQLEAAEDKLKLMQRLEANYGPAENWSTALSAAIASQHPELGERGGDRVPPDVDKLIEAKIAPIRAQLDEANQLIGRVGTGSAIMIDFMSTAPEQWRERYGKPFPKAEFTKFFNESKLNDPYLAYERFEKPHYEKHLEEKHKADIEKARQEGMQSVMSKHGIVETPVNAPTGMFFKINQAQEVDPATGQPKQDTTPAPTHEERKAKVGNAFMKALDQAERNSGTK